METVYATLRSRRGALGVSNLLAVLDQHGGDLPKALDEGMLTYVTGGGNVSKLAVEFVIHLYLGGASHPADWDVEAEANYWVGSERYSDANKLDRMMNGVNTARLWLGDGCLSWVKALHGTYGLSCGLTVTEAFAAGSAINGIHNTFARFGARLGRLENKLEERDLASVSAAPTAGVVNAAEWNGDTSRLTFTLPRVSSSFGSTLVYKPGILSKAIILTTHEMVHQQWAGLPNLQRATAPTSAQLGCPSTCMSGLWGLLGHLDPSTVLSRSPYDGPKAKVHEGDFVVRSPTLMWAARVSLACTITCLAWMCSLGGDLLSAGVAGLISLLVAAVTAIIERGRVYGALVKGLRSYPGGIGVLGDTVDDVVVSSYRLGINPFSENTCWAGSLGTGDIRCGGLRLDKLSDKELNRGVLLGSDDKLYAIPEGPELAHVTQAGPFTVCPDVFPERVGGTCTKT